MLGTLVGYGRMWLATFASPIEWWPFVPPGFGMCSVRPGHTTRLPDIKLEESGLGSWIPWFSEPIEVLSRHNRVMEHGNHKLSHDMS